MGRGRAKAKQAKVARKLKYSTPEMDLDSLQRELVQKSDDHSEFDNSYEKWADEDDWR
ncbi:DUF3073 domain-containing protein [Corynebacterium aquilae]|uniref:DUF3073 domain-containing protein n=1 Tax=Corynebacterium aquilae TaxID=203263 RepID=UPI00095134A1|nr:DUF3073 domain-containing protein [Corynebacterium aquilae]